VMVSKAPIILCLCPGVVGFSLRTAIFLNIAVEVNNVAILQRNDGFFES